MNFSMNIINKNNRMKLFCLAVVAMLAVVGTVYVATEDSDQSDATTYTLTITYDANGGTGAPSAQSTTSTSTSYNFTVSSTIPTRSGYTFLGWSITASATSSSTLPGTVDTIYTSYSTVTLYAVWQSIVPPITTCTLLFDANGGSGAPASETVTSSTQNYSFPIPYTVPTYSGHKFLGWSVTASATSPSKFPGEVTLISTSNSTFTLYAVWEEITLNTISFNGNLGTGVVSDMSIMSDVSIQLPTFGFTKTGYYLSSWNTAADG